MKPDSVNIEQSYMHLTNYSVNKKNPDFVKAGTDNTAAKAADDGPVHADEEGSASEVDSEDDTEETSGGASCLQLEGSYLAGCPKGSGLVEPAKDQRVRMARDGSKWTISALMAYLEEQGPRGVRYCARLYCADGLLGGARPSVVKAGQGRRWLCVSVRKGCRRAHVRGGGARGGPNGVAVA